jgi:nucleoside 2-deoxyribosyltransferase
MPDEIEKSKEKKKCFIITPIGDDDSPIRRHINGIIDAAISPVLSNDYEIIVSHRLSSPGSINKQIINYIYESDLVIANLTTLNPNVMYELAFRHSIRKPVVTIMEKSDKKLPFDVTTERTIFYINDSQGVLNLREALKAYVEEIEKTNIDKLDNPIFSALEGAIKEKNILGKIKTSDPIKSDAVEYILDRLTNIENKIDNKRYNNKSLKRTHVSLIIDNTIVLSHNIRTTISNIISSIIEEITQNRDFAIQWKDNNFEFNVSCELSGYELNKLISNMFKLKLKESKLYDIKFSIEISQFVS